MAVEIIGRNCHNCPENIFLPGCGITPKRHLSREGGLDGFEKTGCAPPCSHNTMDPNRVAKVPIRIFLVRKREDKFTLKVSAGKGFRGTPDSGPDAPGGE